MLAAHDRAVPSLHTLIDDPASADIILFVGCWRERGAGVVDSPLPKTYPDKAFIYVDDDGFSPLLPGIYANAEKAGLFDSRRTESQMFIDSLNPNIQPMSVEKKYLFSFAGGSTSLLRKRLYKMKFERPDVLIENTSSYYHWDPSQSDREERQRRYAATIAASHFVLCPRGASAGGLRLFETMQMGVCPVVISDKLQLPVGPDWERIVIRIAERDLKRVDTILAARVGEAAERGRLAKEAFEQWFAPTVVFNNIVSACARIKQERRVSEAWVRPLWGLMLWKVRMRLRARTMAKSAVLAVFRLMGKRFVYDLNAR